MGECGRFMECAGCATNPAQFDRLSADEIVSMVENSTNPELMGAALKNLFKRASAKAKEVKKKVVSKLKNAPKPLKLAAAVALAPLAPTMAPRLITKKVATNVLKKTPIGKKIAAKVASLPKPLRAALSVAAAPLSPTMAPAMLTAKAAKALSNKKTRTNLIKQVKQLPAKFKKLPKPLKVAAGIALAPFAPTTTAALLTTGAAALPAVIPHAGKIAAGVALKKRMDAKKKAMAARDKNITEARRKSPKMHIPSAVTSPGAAPIPIVPDESDVSVTRNVSTVVPQAAQEAIDRGETTTAAMQATEVPSESTEKKSSGMAALIPLGLLAALPFIL